MTLFTIPGIIYAGLALQSSLLDEVSQVLQGVVPICSVCKKIRPPESRCHDQSQWQNLEVFLSRKMAVEFTHGFCPGCHHQMMDEVGNMGRNR